MKHIYNDGGREAAGYKGDAGDCVTRAIAIAMELPYEKVRTDLMDYKQDWVKTSRSRKAKRAAVKGGSVRNGCHREVDGKYLLDLGCLWTPTMSIGSGCSVHLKSDELPNGRLIAKVSKHVCAVIDGVLHDTFDCCREGTRCVYGYYTCPESLW